MVTEAQAVGEERSWYRGLGSALTPDRRGRRSGRRRKEDTPRSRVQPSPLTRAAVTAGAHPACNRLSDAPPLNKYSGSQASLPAAPPRPRTLFLTRSLEFKEPGRACYIQTFPTGRNKWPCNGRQHNLGQQEVQKQLWRERGFATSSLCASPFSHFCHVLPRALRFLQLRLRKCAHRSIPRWG